MYLKQQSHRASILLERTLQTMAAAAWAQGVAAGALGVAAGAAGPASGAQGAFPWPAEEIRHAWKLFLQNMPHDSICGCSVDEVHAEMSARLRSMAEYTEALLGRCVEAAAGRMRPPPGDGALVVLNPLGHQRTDVVHTVVRMDESLLRAVNYETGALEEHPPAPPRRFPTGIVFIGPDGTEIPGTLGVWWERDIMRLSEDTQPQQLRVREAAASFVARAVPPLGLAAYSYRFTFGTVPPGRRRPAVVENEYLAAAWDAGTATLTVRDKRTGHTFEGLALLEDSGDAGDEYTWSAPLHDSPGALDPATPRVDFGAAGGSSTLYASLRVPERLEENRLSRGSRTTTLRFEIRLSVSPGVPRVDLRVEVDNCAEDHRLRLLFPTGLQAAAAVSEGVFSVDERLLTPADDSIPAGWVEPPSTHPQKSFASVSDGKVGLTVANRGLPEYEVMDRDGAVIAVTLLRCVGWLSRPDLRARKGNGGWTIATPGAQCIGRHVFELSVIPHAGDWDRGGGAREARGFEAPLRAFGLEGAAGTQGTFSVAGVDREEIVVSAVKGSERGGTLIIRLWNSSARPVAARLTLGFPADRAYAVSLCEEREGELPVSHDAVELSFGPWKIRTVEIVPAGRE
jgi:alpha-mannosidase